MMVRFSKLRKYAAGTSAMVTLLLLLWLFPVPAEIVSESFKTEIGEHPQNVFLFTTEHADRNLAHHLLKLTDFEHKEFFLDIAAPFADNRSTRILTASPYERNIFYTYITTHAP